MLKSSYLFLNVMDINMGYFWYNKFYPRLRNMQNPFSWSKNK